MADEINEERFADALGRGLDDARASHAFKALLMGLPSENELVLARQPADPAALHLAREALRARLAVHLGERLREMHGALQSTAEFSPDAGQAGRRALRNAVIDLMVADGSPDAADRARGHFDAALDMTDAMGGLNALLALAGDAVAFRAEPVDPELDRRLSGEIRRRRIGRPRQAPAIWRRRMASPVQARNRLHPARSRPVPAGGRGSAAA